MFGVQLEKTKLLGGGGVFAWWGFFWVLFRFLSNDLFWNRIRKGQISKPFHTYLNRNDGSNMYWIGTFIWRPVCGATRKRKYWEGHFILCYIWFCSFLPVVCSAGIQFLIQVLRVSACLDGGSEQRCSCFQLCAYRTGALGRAPGAFANKGLRTKTGSSSKWLNYSRTALDTNFRTLNICWYGEGHGDVQGVGCLVSLWAVLNRHLACYCNTNTYLMHWYLRKCIRYRDVLCAELAFILTLWKPMRGRCQHTFNYM